MAVTPDALYASILAVHGVSADGLQSADMAHQPTGHAFTTRLEHAIAEAFGAVLIHTRISPPEPMIHASILEARAPRTNRPEPSPLYSLASARMRSARSGSTYLSSAPLTPILVMHTHTHRRMASRRTT